MNRVRLFHIKADKASAPVTQKTDLALFEKLLKAIIFNIFYRNNLKLPCFVYKIELYIRAVVCNIIILRGGNNVAEISARHSLFDLFGRKSFGDGKRIFYAAENPT